MGLRLPLNTVAAEEMFSLQSKPGRVGRWRGGSRGGDRAQRKEAFPGTVSGVCHQIRASGKGRTQPGGGQAEMQPRPETSPLNLGQGPGADVGVCEPPSPGADRSRLWAMWVTHALV